MTFTKPARPVHVTFLHCSASDHAHHDDVAVMRRWHKERGWSDVGYHFFIRKDGLIQTGRPLERTPSAQKGFNTGSIAICLHGLAERAFTAAQFESLRRLCQQINDAYGRMRFRGHREVAAKACPVFDYRSVLNLDADGYLIPDDNDDEEPQPVVSLPAEDGPEFRFARIEQLAERGGSLADIAMHARVGRNLYLDETQ